LEFELWAKSGRPAIGELPDLQAKRAIPGPWERPACFAGNERRAGSGSVCRHAM
jgi:hypothetical protein